MSEVKLARRCLLAPAKWKFLAGRVKFSLVEALARAPERVAWQDMSNQTQSLCQKLRLALQRINECLLPNFGTSLETTNFELFQFAPQLCDRIINKFRSVPWQSNKFRRLEAPLPLPWPRTRRQMKFPLFSFTAKPD
jgi:hypothetical protein